jgi:hypothetical protein
MEVSIKFCTQLGLEPDTVERVLAGAVGTGQLFQRAGPEAIVHACKALGLDAEATRRVLCTPAADGTRAVDKMVATEDAAAIASFGRAARSAGVEPDALREFVEGTPESAGAGGPARGLAIEKGNPLVLEALDAAVGGEGLSTARLAAGRMPAPRVGVEVRPLPHLEKELRQHLGDAAGVNAWMSNVEESARKWLPEPEQREQLCRALLAELRPSPDRLVARLLAQGKVEPPSVATPQLGAALQKCMDPVPRLHPQLYASLTRRSVFSRVFRREPTQSLKLAQKLLPMSATRPRLSMLEADVLVTAQARRADPALRQRLEQALAQTRCFPQYETIPGREPETWSDAHPLSDDLLSHLTAIRDGEHGPGAELVSAIIRDIRSVLQPYSPEGSGGALSIDLMAKEAARALAGVGFHLVQNSDASGDENSFLRQVRTAMEGSTEQKARGVMRVLREHLPPDDLQDLDRALAEDSGKRPPGQAVPD